MLITILLVVIVLVAWSLHLMQQAVDCQEFSLMLAGTLVAFSAAALMAVYCLMGNYLGYVTQMAHYSSRAESVSWTWDLERDDFERLQSFQNLKTRTVSTVSREL